MGASLRCDARHSFDIARQGYVSLLTGKGSHHRSDTADMVAARCRVFDAGLYAPIVEAVAAECSGATAVLDAGGGPGHYLGAALDAADEAAVGVGLDLSRYCARSTARRHRRALSVVADLWQGLPIRDRAVDAVLSVFAPRNAAEVARVLVPNGRWIVVTPEPGHLAEIVEPMHMLTVGEGKGERLAHDLAADFTDVTTTRLTAPITIGEAELVDVAAMGPAAFHRTRAELAAAAAELAATAERVGGEAGLVDAGLVDGSAVSATLDVTVTVARRR